MKQAIVAALVLAASSPAQPPAKGTLDRIKVHGKSLEGNLDGDSPDRSVTVWLPPGYQADPSRRFPVVYFLHGFTDSEERWMGYKKSWINLPDVLDQALAKHESGEMIVVMPDAYTRFAGSMYSNSATTGNWEECIAHDLVVYVDQHYRTLATAESRGLTGHSMGGYGSARIGMKRPDVFSAVYLLSPCCMAAGRGSPAAEEVKTQEDFEKAAFGVKAAFASAAAWSPNPKNPPFFFDLPTQNGEPRPDIVAKWAANAPLAMIDQYVDNIKHLRAFGFDTGAQDTGIAATVRTLDKVMNDYGVRHEFEIYEGNHTNHVADRIETR
jgi:enterochelin esterase-like enzyme